jgi:hypothetical protein
MRAYPGEAATVLGNLKAYVARGEWIPALTIKDFAVAFYPDDQTRQDNLIEAMRHAQEVDQFDKPRDENGGLWAEQYATWSGLPPIPKNSPLLFWLPDWLPREGAAIESAATLEPSAARETAAQRQDQRLQACIAAGLTLPLNSHGRLPDGIGALAEGLGLTRQALSRDVKAALDRRGAQRTK